MAFSPDGRYLGCTRNFKEASVWDLRTGKLTSEFDGEAGRWTLFCAFTADGLFALSEQRRLSFHDPATGREVRSVPVAGRVVAVTPDGTRFVRATDEDEPSRLTLGDVKSGKDLHELDPQVSWMNGTHGVKFTSDGKLMSLFPRNRKEVQVWDVTNPPQGCLVSGPPSRARPAGSLPDSPTAER